MLSDWLARQHLIDFHTLVQKEKVTFKLEVSLEKKAYLVRTTK